jgi:hypothetical protein
VALARPGPISLATSSTVNGASKERWVPSGKVITGLFCGMGSPVAITTKDRLFFVQIHLKDGIVKW